MALSVITRPSKTIEGYESTWNALNLPIQYKLESDLFPVNNVDTVFTITGASNDNGNLKVTINASSTNTLEGETIIIEGCDIDSYNGIFFIKEKVSNTQYVLKLAYDGVPSTGTFQKYYNNYFVEVRLYSGLPSWHEKQASKPMEEVGTLRLIPDISNNIIASFSGLIKDNITFDNQLSGGIDINHFNGFYIEYREAYDENVSGEIVTLYESWEVDESTNCGNDILVNGGFSTDLSGWSQTGSGDTFVWNTGRASGNLSVVPQTQIIYQAVSIIPNTEYQLSYDILRTNNQYSSFDILYLDSSLNEGYLGSLSSSVNQTGNITFVAPSNMAYIGFRFRRFNLASTDVSIESVSLIGCTCQYQFWGANSALQFQNIRGGNMYDYIAKNATSKFMSAFNEPTIFENEYFDDSIILPSVSTNPPQIEDVALMWLNGEDLDGVNGASITEWIDRTGNVTVTGAVGGEPTIIDSGVNGKRGANFNGATQYFETNTNIAQPSIVYVAFFMDDLSSQPLWDSSNASRSAFFVSGTDQLDRLFNGGGNLRNTTVFTTATDYLIKATNNGTSSEIDINKTDVISGNSGTNPMINIDIGYGEPSSPDTYLNGVISEFIILDANTDPCIIWQVEEYLGAKYGIYNTQSYAYVLNEYDNTGSLLETSVNNLTFEDTGLYRLNIAPNNENCVTGDYKIVSSEDCEVSEVKTFKYNKECSNQEIYLTWLNTNGGWDYWKFTAEKDYNLNISDKVTIDRNVFNDWDNTFINGTTQLDVISTTAYNEIDVYSQYLNLDELQAISQLKYSTRVILIDGTKQTTVVVDSDSITLYNDGDEDTLYTIRFKIRLPRIQVQSQ